MIITLECEDCGSKTTIRESNLFDKRKDGSYIWFYARDDKRYKLGFREVILCKNCRPPLDKAGKIYVDEVGKQ